MQHMCYRKRLICIIMLTIALNQLVYHLGLFRETIIYSHLVSILR